MDQKQRITAIVAAVVGLLAIVLVARAIFGGSAEVPPEVPAAMDSFGSAVEDGTIKTAPSPEPRPEEIREPGSGKRAAGVE